MAINFLPGGQAIGVPVQTAATGVQLAGGDKVYENVRGGVTMGYSLFSGFVPINPAWWYLQVPLFIILIIILAVIGAGWWTLPGAYLGQAIVTVIVLQWFLDKFLSFVFGV